MKQRGFAEPLLLYIIAGMGVALLLSWGGLWFAVDAWMDEKAAYAQFQSDVKAKGKAAEKAKADKEVQDKRNKVRTDAEIKRLAALNRSLSDGLLNARTSGGYLPRTSPGTGDPDLACFSRAELESAIGRLDEGVSGLALKGDQAITGIEIIRAWAQSR